MGKCSFGAPFWKDVLLVHPLGRCTFGAPFSKDVPLVHPLGRCTSGAPVGKVYLWCTLGRCSYDASFRKSYLQCCSQLVHVPTSPSDGLTSSNPTHVTPFDSFAQCCLYSLLLLLTSVHQCCPMAHTPLTECTTSLLHGYTQLVYRGSGLHCLLL